MKTLPDPKGGVTKVIATVGVPDWNGNTFTAEFLRKMARKNPAFTFDEETGQLWVTMLAVEG